jgi:xylulokinase
VVTALADVGPAFGAAILAGVGVGVFDSVAAATDRLVHVGGEVAPDPAAVALYRRHHALYDRLYPALQPEFASLAHL